MPRQRAIDIETDNNNNENNEIIIYGKEKTEVKCDHGIYSYCYQCCMNRYKEQEELWLKFEKPRNEKLRSIIANRNYRKKLNQWSNQWSKINQSSPITCSSMKYPRIAKINSNWHETKYIDIIEQNRYHNLLSNISLSIGYQHWVDISPNTSEVRYDIIYRRIFDSCKRLNDDLLKIIIEYLLFDNGWKENFVWTIQLVKGW
jgi:hypothetical protein